MSEDGRQGRKESIEGRRLEKGKNKRQKELTERREGDDDRKH